MTDPPAVLALIAEVRQHRRTIARVEALAEDWSKHTNEPVYETAGELAQVVRDALHGHEEKTQ